MLLSSTTLSFRVHTRVLLTLFVALSISTLGLTRNTPPLAPLVEHTQEGNLSCPAHSQEESRGELPQTLIRVFFLLPQLMLP